MEFVKSEPGADPIIVEAYIDASPADVFRAWTDPNIVKRWFGPEPNTLVSATIDLRVGGAWCFLEHQTGTHSSGFRGEYIVIEPERRLVFSWVKFTTRAIGERASTQPSRVEISLSTNGTGTDLHLTHSGIIDNEMRHGFARGWNVGIGGMLVALSNIGGSTHR